MNLDEKNYKNKYLKYKNKYLELQELEGGDFNFWGLFSNSKKKQKKEEKDKLLKVLEEEKNILLKELNDTNTKFVILRRQLDECTMKYNDLENSYLGPELKHDYKYINKPQLSYESIQRRAELDRKYKENRRRQNDIKMI
jgi:hypothetical protein